MVKVFYFCHSCYINFLKILERAWNYLYPLFVFSNHKLKWFYLLFHLTSLISLSNWPITWGGVVWGKKNKIEHESRERKNFPTVVLTVKKTNAFYTSLGFVSHVPSHGSGKRGFNWLTHKATSEIHPRLFLILQRSCYFCNQISFKGPTNQQKNL